MNSKRSIPIPRHFTSPRVSEDGIYRVIRMILIGIGVLTVLTIPAFVGLIVPFIGIRFTFLLAAGLVSLSLLFIPVQWVLYIAFVLIFGILGPIKYFASVDPQWAGYILGAMMFLRALMESVSKVSQHNRVVLGWSAGYFIFVFITVVVFSSATSPPSPYLALIGIRGFLLLWGFFFLIAVTDLQATTFKKIAFILAFIGLLHAIVWRYWKVPNR